MEPKFQQLVISGLGTTGLGITGVGLGRGLVFRSEGRGEGTFGRGL
jgi:hypothetical protein